VYDSKYDYDKTIKTLVFSMLNSETKPEISKSATELTTSVRACIETLMYSNNRFEFQKLNLEVTSATQRNALKTFAYYAIEKDISDMIINFEKIKNSS